LCRDGRFGDFFFLFGRGKSRHKALILFVGFFSILFLKRREKEKLKSVTPTKLFVRINLEATHLDAGKSFSFSFFLTLRRKRKAVLQYQGK